MAGLTVAFGLTYASFGYGFVSWEGFWEAIKNGMEHSVKFMTLLQRGAPKELVAPWWLTTLNSITGATLIALLVLALRRRFRF